MTEQTEIVEFKQSEAALVLLKERYAVIPDFTTKEGYEEGRQGISELRTLRTSLDKARLRLNKDDQDRIKFRNGEAKRITVELVALEEPLKVAKSEFDMIAEREAEAIRKAEEDRIEAIQFRIGEMTAAAVTQAGMSVDTIDAVLRSLDDCFRGFDFEEFTDAATEERDRVHAILILARSERMNFDEEQAQLEKQKAAMAEEKAKLAAQREYQDKIRAKEQAQLDKEREELAAQQRKVDEERQEAARVMQEAQERAEAEKLAKEQEQDRIEEELAEKERLRLVEEAREARRPDKEKALEWAKKLRFMDGPDGVEDKACLEVIGQTLSFINNASLTAIKQLEEL